MKSPCSVCRGFLAGVAAWRARRRIGYRYKLNLIRKVLDFIQLGGPYIPSIGILPKLPWSLLLAASCIPPEHLNHPDLRVVPDLSPFDDDVGE